MRSQHCCIKKCPICSTEEDCRVPRSRSKSCCWISGLRPQPPIRLTQASFLLCTGSRSGEIVMNTIKLNPFTMAQTVEVLKTRLPRNLEESSTFYITLSHKEIFCSLSNRNALKNLNFWPRDLLQSVECLP